VLHKVAIALYGFGAVLALVLGTMSISANLQNLIPQFGLLEIAYTFVPMFLLMVGVFQAQRAATHIVWVFVPTVLIASFLLLLALLSHAFPDRALLFAVPHLIITVPVGIMLLVRSRRSPSNYRIERPREP
jgi:hypothetical protein